MQPYISILTCLLAAENSLAKQPASFVFLSTNYLFKLSSMEINSVDYLTLSRYTHVFTMSSHLCQDSNIFHQVLFTVLFAFGCSFYFYLELIVFFL